MRMQIFSGMLVLALALTGACAPSTPAKADDTVTISREEKELLDRLKAKELAKADLQKQPAKYINSGTWDKFDKGILNSYSKAVAVEFFNKSQFDVSDIQGRLIYTDGNGAEMANVPFQAEGDVRAGERRKLKVSAGEISGAAAQVKVVVERIRVLGG